MANDRTSVIGHRGAPDEAPENTMPAFRRALELGADGFEFDVQVTSDGHPVVIHDPLLDRTTDGQGPVLAATARKIRALDAGGWFSADFVGSRIPTLDEVLRLPAQRFELEIKAWGRSALDAVIAAVDGAGVFDRVKFTGSSHPMLTRLKAERPDAVIGLFGQRPQPWMDANAFERSILGAAELAGFDVAHVVASDVTEGIVSGLTDLGYLVHANDAVGRDQILRAIDAGVDSLSTDDVALAVALISGPFAQA